MNSFARFGFRNIVNLAYKTNRLDVFGRYKWLQESLNWPLKQRQEWRLQRLGDVLEFAWNHVPFYREFWGDHGVEFRRPRALEELERYPALSKSVFRANAARIQPDNLDSIRHLRWTTGGTTGEPVHYGRDLDQWTLGEAFHLWGWSQMGYSFGDPVGVIAGGSLVPERKTIKGRARGWMHRRLFLYGVAMDRPLAREHHARLVKYGAEYLYGYPSILYLFSKHLAEQGLTVPGLKAVVTTAEMLLPQYRKGIERSLGCPVFDNLGCNDGGYESYECGEHCGLHYNDLQAILETGREATELEGHLLITNLWNRSTPFIRYENGDKVQLSTERCVCGAPFPLISSIEGRTADILSFSNGKSLAGPALTLIFGGMEIDGWQVVQTSRASLEVRICTPGALRSDYVDRIKRVLNLHLNNGHEQVAIQVCRVDRLELTAAGKLKPIWISQGF